MVKIRTNHETSACALMGKRFLLWRSIAIGAVIAAAALGTILHLRDQAHFQAETNMRNLGRAIAGQTEAALTGITFALEEMREAIERQPIPTPEGLAKALQTERANLPFLRDSAVVGPDGVALFFANQPMPSPPTDFSDRAWFQDVRDNPARALQIGEPVRSRVSGLWFIPLVMRLQDSRGRFAGAVVGILDPGFFERAFKDYHLGQGAAIALQRRDSLMLARLPADETIVGKTFPKGPIYRVVKDGKDGFVRSVSAIDGTMRLISGTHLGKFPVYVAISITEEVALAGWRTQSAIIALAALALFALIAAMTRTSIRLQTESEARLQTVERLDRAVRQLAESEHVLKEAQEVADLGYYVYDLAADRWTSSPVLDRIFGIDDKYERTSQGWLDLVAPESREAMRDYLRAVLAAGGRFDHEYEILHPTDGSRRWVHGLGRIENDAEGRPARMLGTIRDVTLARRREEDIRRSNAELEQFAYIASHDLREPLRTVSSFVSLLERRYADKLDDEGREFIHFAKDGAERMDRLVLDLLDYSRVGRIAQPVAPVALGEVLARVRENLAEALLQAGAEMVVADEPPIVKARADEMSRLFQNLIDNALKYRASSRPCRIEIRARREASFWRIEVIDNGIGIKPDYFERIFRIFQRLHPIDAYGGGSGIGLAICEKIVKSHGGRIGVESDGASGTTFFFTLPSAP